MTSAVSGVVWLVMCCSFARWTDRQTNAIYFDLYCQ